MIVISKEDLPKVVGGTLCEGVVDAVKDGTAVACAYQPYGGKAGQVGCAVAVSAIGSYAKSAICSTSASSTSYSSYNSAPYIDTGTSCQSTGNLGSGFYGSFGTGGGGGAAGNNLLLNSEY